MTKQVCCALLFGLLGCHGTGGPGDRTPSKEPDMKVNATGGGAAPGAIVGGDGGKGRRARLRALVEADAPTIHDELVAAATDPDPFVRGEVAHQVAAVRDPQALAILDRLSNDPAVLVRALVVEALDLLGGDAAHAIVLRFAADDPSEDVRGQAVRALEHIAGPDAERALSRLTNDPVPVVRDRAVEALARRRQP